MQLVVQKGDKNRQKSTAKNIRKQLNMTNVTHYIITHATCMAITRWVDTRPRGVRGNGNSHSHWIPMGIGVVLGY